MKNITADKSPSSSKCPAEMPGLEQSRKMEDIKMQILRETHGRSQHPIISLNGVPGFNSLAGISKIKKEKNSPQSYGKPLGAVCRFFLSLILQTCLLTLSAYPTHTWRYTPQQRLQILPIPHNTMTVLHGCMQHKPIMPLPLPLRIQG